ncbi:DoxX family membrane protein [Micromonospora sp. LZ34]
MGYVIARVLIALLFVVSGAATAMDPEPRRRKAEWFGHPPLIAVRANGIGMVVLAMIFVTGYHARWTAIGLMVLLGLTTIGGHAFWRESGPDRSREVTQFLKNTAVLGGLLAFALG